MTDEVLLTQNDDGVLTVTMNRPDRLNALTIPLMRGLEETLRAAATDPAVRVVVLTGAGRGFCSGGDMREGRKDDRAGDRPKTDPRYNALEERFDRVRSFSDASLHLFRMRKPTIAAVRGPCVGAGFAMSLACDFRVVSNTATFLTGFISAGFSGDYGAAWFLTQHLGTAKAREILMLNPKLDATAVDRLGLVTRLVEDTELEAQAAALARQLADGPPVTLRAMKQNLNSALTETPEAAMDIEIVNMARTTGTEDQKEAVMAMMEKRKPVFRGV
ncbi:enoyl-CoA hydratase [Frigidibacter albus]|uniref:Enoyl-CoA hydratase n=1 Tax=Frigidibacter albus TaxID=1465486 RepID=A0A6L8VMT5_9RHOB|nr:enoyl-CoA hydratase [Frigidibacter albus]MZQ91106.1 enoyl-CoA hydratase [Frigidibacter albus]NBE32991.1 enoyl-CoA hydratase [Frigidibacter albus]GGH62810.1 enoyl-CoA hydratase [Frigidibacter albus]